MIGLIAVALLANMVGSLPDKSKTPGQFDPAYSRAKLCAPDFHTSAIRNVSDVTKTKVYSSYKMGAAKPPCPCEVDHLGPLELGGTNDQANLWPQSYAPPGNAREKDVLENKLHEDMCAGIIGLPQAQQEITTDWVASYNKHVAPLSQQEHDRLLKEQF